MRNKITIGTRGSKLALVQSNLIKGLIEKHFSTLSVTIKIITTLGDKILDKPLDKIGDKGLFTRELEYELLSESIDLAVHSLKDMPTELSHSLEISAYSARSEFRDCLVSGDGSKLMSLKRGSVVGTSSLRRASQLLSVRPDLKMADMRGNVETRLKKLKDGKYDAIVLAAAGLERLSLGNEITELLDTDIIIPAAGQGIIAVETKSTREDLKDILKTINNADSECMAIAERSLLNAFGGGCSVPIGAFSFLKEDMIEIHAYVGSLDGKTVLKDSISGKKTDAENLGKELARKMLSNGAAGIVEHCKVNFSQFVIPERTGLSSSGLTRGYIEIKNGSPIKAFGDGSSLVFPSAGFPLTPAGMTTSDKGKVFIVGSGPGDMDLMTIKAIQILKAADVILYDELVNSALLENCKPEAEIVYVGKKAGEHAFPQNEIESLMVKRAKQGNTVCRLKGGDPLLFGRGGEEMEILKENGIPFEVVPGVTSAIAALAYAGIPITHRGVTSGVAIFTGHEDPAKEKSDLNWASIAKLNTTLVFLMGVKNLAAIADNLLKNGMPDSTPVAIVYRGTTPFQKTFTGTLNTIAQVADREHIEAPSIIVVGNVVKLRERLKWFEQKPLFGKNILVTRMKSQASQLSNLLRGNAAIVKELPTINIIPNEEAYPELDAAIKNISDYNWVIFTSVSAVDVFFDRMNTLGLDSRIFSGIKICTIGPATKDKLAEFSLKANVMPERYIAESVYESLKGKVAGQKILLPRSDIARKELVELLKNEDAQIDEIQIYRTVKPSYSSEEITSILKDVEMVTFTSASTVRNFTEILGNELEIFKGNFVAASIGPVTSEALSESGIKIACEAKEYTIPGLADAIVEYYNN